MLASLPPTDALYAALARRDPAFEGAFVTAVRSTGVCCRPMRPARTPRRESVEFLQSVEDTIAAGYRPCRRRRPLERAGAPPADLQLLLDTLGGDPSRRWRDADLQAQGLSPDGVRRWFKRHHGMTFHAYQRAVDSDRRWGECAREPP
jgi:AraC family transcriptional regulator, regulatory protein of adaptative response / methylated-DNA-[protein]-cysteine methyltransferase